MDFACNLPFFSIMLLMISGIVSPVFGPRAARRVCIAAIGITVVLSAWLAVYTHGTGESFTYMMGHFPAPFGNEIRAGVLEAVMALCMSVVALLCVWGNADFTSEDVPEKKQNLYYIMINLLMASLLALVYTNDIFTAYVFVEINTIAACAIVMSKPGGDTVVATLRYLIMSLLGSGMLLFGITMLYGITGHLLMSPMQESIALLVANGEYTLPLIVIIGLFSIGLGIKSALFPFHSWLPDAHGSATPASSGILSGLVLKGYILLLIKLFYRVFGMDTVLRLNITNALLVMGLLGMVVGSVRAIREKRIKHMIAFSSVAQIGYIFVGIGIGSAAGMVAACFHILAHMVTKPMLFTAAGGLINASGHKKDFESLKGSAWRSPAAGAAFVVGSLSMIGIPLFSGFISKFYLAHASIGSGFQVSALLVLALSTVLNALYYLPAIAVIYARPKHREVPAGQSVPHATRHDTAQPAGTSLKFKLSLLAFALLNFALGIYSSPILVTIEQGLLVFA